jgi:hypothetical protein
MIPMMAMHLMPAMMAMMAMVSAFDGWDWLSHHVRRTFQMVFGIERWWEDWWKTWQIGAPATKKDGGCTHQCVPRKT